MSLAKYLDLTAVAAIRIDGRGGKEAALRPILQNWRRVGAALYDYEIDSPDGVVRVEVKKQANLQWFDVGKYYNLSADARSIWMLFVLHERGKVTRLVATRLGTLIDFLCSEPKYQRLGWNAEVIETAARFKIRYPALQFKVPAPVERLCQDHPELFESLYSAS